MISSSYLAPGGISSANATPVEKTIPKNVQTCQIHPDDASESNNAHLESILESSGKGFLL